MGEGTDIVQPALTYLANTISCNGREIPYSTITAIDLAERPPLGPFLSEEGKPLPLLKTDEIALNSWAAEQLHAKVGEMVRVAFFEPESIEGQVREKTVSMRLAAIVKLAAGGRRSGIHAHRQRHDRRSEHLEVESAVPL